MLNPVKRFLFLLVGLLMSISGMTQGSTDLYVFDLQQSGNTFHIFQPKFLSSFNPGGYTNQPFFTPDGDLLVSVRFADGNQNDIYRLALDENRIRRLTQTTSNEYSPRLDPTREYLSVLRQVEGDSMNQQVFRSKLTGGGYKTITPDRKDVGYYSWLDNDHLALFRIEGETHRLERYSISDQKGRKITSAIGRTLWTDEEGAVTYVHKFSTDYWYIKKYYAKEFRMEIIVQTPGMTEDFAIGPDGTFFMGHEGSLYSYHPKRDDDWSQIADLTVYGIENVTRIAISEDGTKLALVSPKNQP